MTEASPVIVTTSEVDLHYGSSGCLVPGSRAKVIDAHGNEVTALDTRGELLSQSPSVVLGYLNNEKANAETFVWHDDGRWLRTGDEVLVQKSAQGTEHFVITDRIKELIKVKVCPRCSRLTRALNPDFQPLHLHMGFYRSLIILVQSSNHD